MFALREVSWKCVNQRLMRQVRCYESAPSSREIRRRFLDFFSQHDHTFVRGSPVVPYNDPTLAFVNAGMNQFKPVFLGSVAAPCKRAVNSQKCIRVGGKHNDLEDVGKDGYHHTFFEMLGTWSFGDYFKTEACSMAWNLLTQVYKIPPNKLFVTYFGGDEKLCLPPDIECKDIWLSLGVDPDHILPFGMKENFWEMGLVGPCGPCSEVHVVKGDLSKKVARSLVNKDSELVVEIWNLVFMQHNRLSPQVLESLPARHIDTGMGLERLVAYLQGKQSNYETDLFLPLIDAIHRISGGDPYSNDYSLETQRGQRDWAYRLLADHARMITIALADGAFPENNHRLRRVIRQAISTSGKYFQQKGSLMLELGNLVADMLCDVYPEVGTNLHTMKTLFQFEEDLFDDNLSKSSQQWKSIVHHKPSLSVVDADQQSAVISSIRQLEEWSGGGDSVIPGHLAFKLYDTYGLHEESLRLLASASHWSVDWHGLQRQLDETRRKTLSATSALPSTSDSLISKLTADLPATDTSFQHDYNRTEEGDYQFGQVHSTLLAIAKCDDRLAPTSSALAGEKVIMIFDKTNFYCEAGGQVGDRGSVTTTGAGGVGRARVTESRQSGRHVVHFAVIEDGSFRVQQLVRMTIDEENRMRIMANHTGTHLLQTALKDVFKVTCQKSSHVDGDHLKFDFGLFRSSYTDQEISAVESIVRRLIRQALPVDRLNLPLHQAVGLDHVTLVPGETYPDMVHVLRVQSTDGDLISVEPCCGTHVRNTSDLQDFAIVNIKSSGVASRSIRAVTRSAATEAYQRVDQFACQVNDLHSRAQLINDGDRDVPTITLDLLHELDGGIEKLKEAMKTNRIPYCAARDLEIKLHQLESKVRSAAQQVMSARLEEQIKSAVQLNSNWAFIVHVVDMPNQLVNIGRAKLSLIKATRHCVDKPILILAYDDGCIVSRCTVPKDALRDDFDAQKWSDSIVREIGGRGAAPKGQNCRLVYNVRTNKIKDAIAVSKLRRAAQLARDFAERNL